MNTDPALMYTPGPPPTSPCRNCGKLVDDAMFGAYSTCSSACKESAQESDDARMRESVSSWSDAAERYFSAPRTWSPSMTDMIIDGPERINARQVVYHERMLDALAAGDRLRLLSGEQKDLLMRYNDGGGARRRACYMTQLSNLVDRIMVAALGYDGRLEGERVARGIALAHGAAAADLEALDRAFDSPDPRADVTAIARRIIGHDHVV